MPCSYDGRVEERGAHRGHRLPATPGRWLRAKRSSTSSSVISRWSKTSVRRNAASFSSARARRRAELGQRRLTPSVGSGARHVEAQATGAHQHRGGRRARDGLEREADRGAPPSELPTRCSPFDRPARRAGPASASAAKREVVACHRRLVGLAVAGLVDDQGAEAVGEDGRGWLLKLDMPDAPGPPPCSMTTGGARGGVANLVVVQVHVSCGAFPVRTSRRAAGRRPNSPRPNIGQRPLRVVDRVHPARVRVPPEPLDRRADLQRPPAGVLEQQVHRADRLAGAASPGRAGPAAAAAAGSSARAWRASISSVMFCSSRQPGRVDQRRGLGDPHLPRTGPRPTCWPA